MAIFILSYNFKVIIFIRSGYCSAFRLLLQFAVIQKKCPKILLTLIPTGKTN